MCVNANVCLGFHSAGPVRFGKYEYGIIRHGLQPAHFIMTTTNIAGAPQLLADCIVGHSLGFRPALQIRVAPLNISPFPLVHLLLEASLHMPPLRHEEDPVQPSTPVREQGLESWH